MPATVTAPAHTSFAPAPRRAPSALVIPPAGGRTVAAFGDTLVFKLGDADTGGALSLAFATTPPGGGPPPHRHLDEDELFLLVSGREEYFLDGRWAAVEPGSVVYVPRGVVHTFRNVGDGPSQKWTLTTSGGFDRFFTACGEVFDAAAAAGAPPDMGRIVALFAEHRLELAG
jgi:mannose-6-phosphate isomerase-like protein (cupin superfamily)